MPRLLITGVSGFLGWNLFRALCDRFEVVGTYSANPSPEGNGRFFRLDLRDPLATEKSILEIAPAIVIHAAALTSPALCMADRFLAWETNVLGTVNIARMARKINARFLYISTDRVFDGKRGWYTEDDPPAPLGYYETTKLAGEEQARAIIPNALIVRLPLMYGPKSPAHGSFLEWMFEGFHARTSLDLFTDQFRTPLYVEDAGLAFRLLLERPELSGAYHLAGTERISRSDFGYRMAEIFGFDPGVIRPLRMADKPGIPPTPADVSLNSDKLFRAVGFCARGVTEGLRACKTALDFKRLDS